MAKKQKTEASVFEAAPQTADEAAAVATTAPEGAAGKRRGPKAKAAPPAPPAYDDPFRDIPLVECDLPQPDGDPAPKPRRGRKAKGDGTTLAALAEAYLAHLESVGKSRGTVFSYSIDLALATKALGAETDVETITPAIVSAFFESDTVTKTRTGKPKAKPTIDKTRRVLRLALVWAAETGLIAEAPLP